MSNLVKLTPEQIEDIVQALPQCMSCSTKVANKMREQIQNKLRLQLSDEKIVNKPEAIEKLKAMIRMMHFNALAVPGDPVGIRAAEANSQPVTQSALSAFHSAGSKGSVAAGIDALRELYAVSETRKNEMLYIHFKDKNLIFDDVIELRRDLEGVTVKDLLSFSEGETLIKYEKENEPWWYNLYLDLTKQKLPFNRDEVYDEDDKRNIFLRLKFDTNKLYSYNVTPYNIAQKMDFDEIICIPSPANEGIIDIFVDSRKAALEVEKKSSIKGKGLFLSSTIYNSSLLFFQISLIPQLKSIYVNGIPGVSQLNSIGTDQYNVLYLVKTEHFIEDKKVWRLVINKVSVIINGIPIQKLINTLKLCNFEIVEITKDYIDVYSEESFTTKKSPKDIITSRVKETTKLFEERIEDLNKKGVDYSYKNEYPVLLNEFKYIYGYARGSNLIKILAHPLIDSTRTLCSNPHEILKTLGIEATRNFMIKSYLEINKINNSYVNPHHIALAADFQTSKGVLLNISSKGVARQNPGPLAQASFEHPMEAFIDAAVFGKDEKIKSTSSSIFVGKRMILGTGSFKARIDLEALQKAEEASRKYRLENPERFNRISESAQRVFNKTLVNEDYLFVHSEDDNRNGLVGIDSVNAVEAAVMSSEFKYRNPVPKASPTKLPLPNFIKNIITQDILGENSSMFKVSSDRLVENNTSLIKGSISKAGLPALPKMNVSQLISSSRQKNFISDEEMGVFIE